MNGYTLLELLVVLTAVAVLTALGWNAASATRDRIAVRVARESLIALSVEARAQALRRGHSTLVVSADSMRAWIEVDQSVARALSFGERGGLALRLPGGRNRFEAAFGPLGLGRFANGTLEFTSGASSAGVTISSYGRVRRF